MCNKVLNSGLCTDHSGPNGQVGPEKVPISLQVLKMVTMCVAGKRRCGKCQCGGEEGAQCKDPAQQDSPQVEALLL